MSVNTNLRDVRVRKTSTPVTRRKQIVTTQSEPSSSPSSMSVLTSSRTTSHSVSEEYNLTWTDAYGLAVDEDFDGKTYANDAEEAEAKKTALSYAFGGAIVRWNQEDWAAGLYGPPDSRNSRSATGWVVQRYPRDGGSLSEQGTGRGGRLSQQRIDEYFRQGRTRQHRIYQRVDHTPTNAVGQWLFNNLEGLQGTQGAIDPQPVVLPMEPIDNFEDEILLSQVPLLPELEGDDSWLQGIDEMIENINNGGQSSNLGASDNAKPSRHLFQRRRTPEPLNDHDIKLLAEWMERGEQSQRLFCEERTSKKRKHKPREEGDDELISTLTIQGSAE